MTIRTSLREYAGSALTLLFILSGAAGASAQQQGHVEAGLPETAAPPGGTPGDSNGSATSSTEQGRTPLPESFETWREWRIEKRRGAFEDTQFKFDLRAFYFDRKKFDGSESEAFAIGGWMGLKTGYFFDHLALGATVYTSQPISAPDDKEGTNLLKPGGQGYTVLGEAYADIRIVDDLNLYVGRKGFDTPYINRNDNRMTPNTFEAIVLQGKSSLGENGGTLKYGAGYFDRIKEHNSDRFVSMSEVAGTEQHRGVYTAGVLYEKGLLSLGAIDYFSPDVINIGYTEAKLKLPISAHWEPSLAAQLTDQRSVGDNFLQEDYFEGRQFGIKADLPIKKALLTVGYTYTSEGVNMRNPWGGYPGYTSVQVQDFNRAGEGAFIIRAGYEFPNIKGLSTYALAVLGTTPNDPSQYRQDEYDANLQWAPPEGVLKGLSLRLRYAIVQQDGGDVRDLKDFRVICNYEHKF